MTAQRTPALSAAPPRTPSENVENVGKQVTVARSHDALSPLPPDERDRLLRKATALIEYLDSRGPALFYG
ncbi:hypothetical protein ACH40E_38995 [Streptomyces acidicola]|uniref:hypothetical protein n=1 Tax=Streptomyces acidicola TaxID=2596892 RepID=UPI0037A4779A